MSVIPKASQLLVHVVGAEGIQTDPEKVCLIAEWPAPRTLKEVRGLLGLTGYYVIVRPLSTVEYTSVASLFHRRQWSD